ncbi:MAG TPA: hypothetical protein VN673_14455, partial [Clostridia bacterium]|nr:hypothetical protein [Clostridia bacterium]
FFDLTADPFEENPLELSALEGAQNRAAKKLQGVLDQFKDARPVKLDRQFEASMKDVPEGQKKGRKKNK